MKIYRGILVAVALVAASGCARAENGANDEGAKVSGQSGGVEQGNGLLSYDNPTMNVRFSYPRDWKLVESDDRRRVRLDNSSVATQAASMIEFSYLTQLDEKSFKSASELKAYILKTRPDRKWQDVVMLSNLGVMWSSSEGMKQNAEYFVLDKNQFILHVSYSADQQFGGERVIREIVRGMILDEEPPVIEGVWFDRKEARPGETVRLIVKVVDRLSGVQIESMGGKPRGQGNWNWYLHLARGAVGYYFPDFKDANNPAHTDKTKVELAMRAQPFLGDFRYIGDDCYAYDLSIPEHAPLGEMSLNIVEVSDYFGNKTRLTAFERNNDSIMDRYSLFQGRPRNDGIHFPKEQKTDLDRISFRVVADEGHVEDRTPPKVADLYFDRTSIDLNSMAINMYLVLDDQSEVPFERHRTVDFSTQEEDIAISWSVPEIAGNLSCLDSKANSAFEKLGRNFFRRTMDLSSCKYAIEGAVREGLVQTRIVVKPKAVWLFDSIGLSSETGEEQLNLIPRARFFIRLK